MPIRGVGEGELTRRFVASLRVIEGIPVDRARVRTTLVYRFTDAFQAGIEVNPRDDDVGPLANWRVLDETERRPAVVLGTSSDRIGSTNGRAFYVTASKDLERHVGLPVAPYVGLSYGEFRDELVGLGGLTTRWGDRLTSMHLYDGYNVHHVGTYVFDNGLSAGLVAAEQEGDTYWGLSFGFAFANPLSP